MEEQDVAQNDNDNAVTHGIYENVVAHVDNDNNDADPDWSENRPPTSANRVGRPPKRGRGRPRIHQRGGNTNRGRSTRTQPQAQKEPNAPDQPSGEKKTVTPFFETRKTRATAKKDVLVLQEAIRTSTEPDSRHGSRALSAGADQHTVYPDLRASIAGPEKSRHDYAVQPLQIQKTTKRLPEQEMDSGKKTGGDGTKNNLLNGSQGHTQGFIQAQEPLIYPDGFSKLEQQTALERYGDDIVSEFRAKWRGILKSTDTPNQGSSVDVWKSLLDPGLATRFRASLSARYREYIDWCKQKKEQGTPKRITSGQPQDQQQQEQKQKQPWKRQHEEGGSQDRDDSPVPPHAKRRKLATSPQPKETGKRQHEEVESQDQYESPIFSDPRRSKLAATPQSDSSSFENPGPNKGSAWRVIREPNGNSVTDVSRIKDMEAESPSKKFSFRIRKEPIAKAQTPRKNNLTGKR
ncbi:hypothetical protein QBC45DRAFT_22623 [Copromyces sp. CBS 386.78]|nr:hypothetical protein QBC45DRAFT_22623 [Copromyces sp. CBS 386.78]